MTLLIPVLNRVSMIWALAGCVYSLGMILLGKFKTRSSSRLTQVEFCYLLSGIFLMAILQCLKKDYMRAANYLYSAGMICLFQYRADPAEFKTRWNLPVRWHLPVRWKSEKPGKKAAVLH